MPLLDCKVGLCSGPRPALAAEQDAAGPEAFVPCDRGGACPRSLDLDSLKAKEVRGRMEFAVRVGDRDKLAELLREAQSAHHAAVGDAEDDWAAWYASYLLGAVV